jgi:hypothetical protein
MRPPQSWNMPLVPGLLESVDCPRRTDAKGNDMRNLPLIVILLLGTPTCFAQGGHMGTPEEQKACSRDASRFCRKQLGDDTAVQQCLQQNRTKLSPACQKVFQSHGM